MWGELLVFLQKENLPGSYPYTGGVYPYRRSGEDRRQADAGPAEPERRHDQRRKADDQGDAQ